MSIDWGALETTLRDRAVRLLHPHSGFRMVYVGGYTPEPDLIDTAGTPLTPESIRDFFRAIEGDASFKGPVDVLWELNGEDHILRLQPDELDAISYNEIGNIRIIDQPPTVRDLLRAAKSALDRHRGYIVPTEYRMTQYEWALLQEYR